MTHRTRSTQFDDGKFDPVYKAGIVSTLPHIAIIDDDASLRDALMRLARSLGMRAGGYASAEEFLTARDTECFDCIITDIHMPGMSGIDLKIHLATRNCILPVIMIAGKLDGDLEKRAREAGASAFLLKPFAPGAVVASLERVLRPLTDGTG
jgi:FixJ family two-component response regulator